MTCLGTISYCTNKATISGKSGNIAGIVGAAYRSTEANQEMNITNCDNYGNITGTGFVGGIVGLSSANIKECTNTSKITLTGTGTSLGGIVGEQRFFGTISYCSNSGDVSGESMGFGAGGIVGWIRYYQGSSYKNQAVIKVSNNENFGYIQGGTTGGSSGGIVGHAYNQAIVTKNTNKAPSISGKTFAAGIVGSLQYSSDNEDLNEDIRFIITGNKTGTTIDQITSSCAALITWNNDGGDDKFAKVSDNTDLEGNTIDNQTKKPE